MRDEIHKVHWLRTFDEKGAAKHYINLLICFEKLDFNLLLEPLEIQESPDRFLLENNRYLLVTYLKPYD